jgi:hypothetical protein
MDAQLMGDEVNAVSSHHVEGSVGDVYDAGNTKDQGKPDSEKGECAPTDETAQDDIDYKIHKAPRPGKQHLHVNGKVKVEYSMDDEPWTMNHEKRKINCSSFIV